MRGRVRRAQRTPQINLRHPAKAETNCAVRKLLSALVVAWLLVARVSGQPTPLSTPAASSPAAELGAGDAIILGIVEGVTEFLPVSSTGHLIIANRLLGLESDTPLRSRDGQPLWYKKPSEKNPAGEPLTLKLAANTYAVVIQFGAIAAVALLYWPQLMAMLLGLLGRDRTGRQLLINVLVAFLPAAIIGFLAHSWIDAHFSVKAVIAAQVMGAGLMFVAEYWRKHQASGATRATYTHELSTRAAAGIGLLQCLALWPGMSRSMTTIVGGYFAGLDPRRSAEFSFLLGLVTLSAASLFKSYKSGAAMVQVFGVPHVLLGAVVAAVTAALCVRFLVRWLTQHGLGIFAWYRLALAGALTAWLYLGK
jgi:undecaprenyl-diphosphatase